MHGNQDVSQLTDHLGYWLRMVSNHVSHAFAGRLAERGVTVAEWVMLRSLYREPPLAPSRLAETMSMTRGAITKLADRLIDKALVVRRPSAEDARAQTLALTAAGSRLVPQLACLADENDAAAFSALSRAERAALESLLHKLAGSLGPARPPIN